MTDRKIAALESSNNKDILLSGKNDVTLDSIRKLMASDKRYISRHPILKHLFARYEAVINDVTKFGLPNTRIEPIEMFNNRVNELTVEHANKQIIRRKRIKARIMKQTQERTRRKEGQAQYQRSH